MYGHYTRQSSVILNPRGRVLSGFAGLGEEGGGGDASGSSGDSSGGGFDTGGVDSQGYTGFALARAEAEMAAQDAAYAAKEAAQFANAVQSAEAQAAAIAAAEEAAYTAQEAARFANAAASAKAASAAAQAELTQRAAVVSSVVQTVASKFGPIGFIAAMVEKVTGFVGSLVAGTATSSGYTNAQQAIDNARNQAGGDPQLHAEITKVQNSLDAVKNAGVEAAIKQLYATYAHRAVDPGAMKYWSDRFGPTVTPNEVLQFQEFLYANEPNLRPAVTAKITSAAGAGTGLALPLIAAIAGYFILGS
jgi:hypothetical protein